MDGLVYRVLDAYAPELALGNIATQSLQDILASEAYGASLRRDSDEHDEHCKECVYRMACTRGHIYDSRVTSPYKGACPTAYHCIKFMQRYVREQGYDDADVRALWKSVLATSDSPAIASAS